jgi:hypothetical protein
MRRRNIEFVLLQFCLIGRSIVPAAFLRWERYIMIGERSISVMINDVVFNKEMPVRLTLADFLREGRLDRNIDDRSFR